MKKGPKIPTTQMNMTLPERVAAYLHADAAAGVAMQMNAGAAIYYFFRHLDAGQRSAARHELARWLTETTPDAGEVWENLDPGPAPAPPQSSTTSRGPRRKAGGR